MNSVETSGLRRTYANSTTGRGRSGHVALAGLDLTIPAGETHGLLGPNGAGKTTLCRILSTALLPTAGRASVHGHDVVAEAGQVRRAVGVVLSGERGLYGRLTARQNLRFWASLYGLSGRRLRPRIADLLDRVGLSAWADSRVETFSTGMRQRLHLARGLVHDPAVLLLDEPTSGMDPTAAHEFRRMVAELRGLGRTTVLTTHDMAEAEAVCDRVTLIDRGRLVTTAQPGDLRRWAVECERIDAWDVAPGVRAGLSTIPDVVSVGAAGDGATRIRIRDAAAVAEVLRYLANAGVTRLSSSPPSLEEVYLHLVGPRGIEVPAR